MAIDTANQATVSLQTNNPNGAKLGNGQRVTSTRNTILDAAVSLYQSQGIDQTSISAIIEKSGIGRTTFYRHFNDHDDVLNQALKRDFDLLMTEFENSSRHYDSLEVQIEEDIIWFLDQFQQRPALCLLYSDIEWQQYQQTAQSVAAFKEASIACTTPTYQRALAEGRLHKNTTLETYLDWSSLMFMSMTVLKLPSMENRIRRREMIRNFFIPSVITIDE